MTDLMRLAADRTDKSPGGSQRPIYDAHRQHRQPPRRIGQLIKIVGLTHETLQPTKHEAAKGGQGPILPTFNRPAQSAQPNSPPTSISPTYERPK
jgi:hypothetical protein